MNLFPYNFDYISETGFKLKTGGDVMSEFEQLFNDNKLAVERFVKFKISKIDDAEDILQEVFLIAFENFDKLNNKEAFKAWLIGIARNKCNDYYRKKASAFEISIDELTDHQLYQSRLGYIEVETIIDVNDIMQRLGNRDKEILYLSYWKWLPHSEIAKKLGIPVGTVKSRLFTAKKNFKAIYTFDNLTERRNNTMKNLPDNLPKYTITNLEKEPFEVKCEELQGLSIIPKLNEKTIWGLYDFDTKKCNEYSEVSVVGRIDIHGIEGVEIDSIQYDLKNKRTNKRQFAAQLTDNHCRYLAESHLENDLKKCITFLDGEIFMNNWGFGEDNCGNETLLKQKGLITRKDNTITKNTDKETTDIVGRYEVNIFGKSYDTVCSMELGHFKNSIAIEMYIDKNGRTVLWRRFNRDDWAINRYKTTWSERLPNNEKLIINGEVYVHWYDCITDYIL